MLYGLNLIPLGAGLELFESIVVLAAASFRVPSLFYEDMAKALRTINSGEREF